MDKLNIDSQLQNTLSKFSSSLFQISQGAIVTKEIYNLLLLGQLHKKILTGSKIHYHKLNLIFDVVTEINEMNQLPNLDGEIVPMIHCFNYPEIRSPQRHLLTLNKQFPMITKAFVCFQNLPLCKRLITNSFGSKMFVPGSYILFDPRDYFIDS